MAGTSHVTDFNSAQHDVVDLTAFHTTFALLDSNNDGVLDAGDADALISATSDGTSLTLHFLSSGGTLTLDHLTQLHAGDLHL